MTVCFHELASELPGTCRRLKLPVNGVSVVYKRAVYCRGSVPGGNSEMDVPDEAIAKIKDGSARVAFVTRQVPKYLVGDDGRDLQLTMIEIIDIRRFHASSGLGPPHLPKKNHKA